MSIKPNFKKIVDEQYEREHRPRSIENKLIWCLITSDVNKYTDEGWIIKQIAPEAKHGGVYVVLEREKKESEL